MKTDLLELIGLAIENERQVARYYRAMADLLPEHKATWDLLSHQEEGHATALMRVREAVECRPLLFSPGRYKVVTVRKMIRDISTMIDDIRGRAVSPQYTLTFASDVEQALLESGLDEIVTTTVPEVLETLRWLKEQTTSHRDLLRGVAL